MPLYSSQVCDYRFFLPLWFTPLLLIFLFSNKNIEVPKKTLSWHLQLQINKSIKTLIMFLFINIIYSILDFLLAAAISSLFP